jgi:hypothetical protein
MKIASLVDGQLLGSFQLLPKEGDGALVLGSCRAGNFDFPIPEPQLVGQPGILFPQERVLILHDSYLHSGHFRS